MPTAAAACCAWVDEVLRDSVEWWTFTQSFAGSASALMLHTQRRRLASKALSLISMINKRPHTRRTIVLKRTALVKDEQ